MLRNRSVPTDVVLPHIIYENVAEALAWLTIAFGFTEHYRYGDPDGPVNGAQMYLGDAWIQLGSARPGRASPAKLGSFTQSLTVLVTDVDAHYNRAKSAGAKIVGISTRRPTANDSTESKTSKATIGSSPSMF